MMSTLSELLECHKFDVALKEICSDLFCAHFCPKKIHFLQGVYVWPMFAIF